MKYISRPGLKNLYIGIFIGFFAFPEDARSEGRADTTAETRIIATKETLDKEVLLDPALDISIDLLVIIRNLIDSRADNSDPNNLVTILKCILPSLEKSFESIDFKKLERSKTSDLLGHSLGDFKRVLDASTLLIEARKTEGDRIYPANKLLLEKGVLPLDEMIKLLTKLRRASGGGP